MRYLIIILFYLGRRVIINQQPNNLDNIIIEINHEFRLKKYFVKYTLFL